MNRKQNIIRAAEWLFSEHGFENTSTHMIAKEAGVSEGLIFKHFGTKKKLLEYLVKNGYRRIVEHNPGLLQDSRPLDFIDCLLDMPHKLVKDEPLFWKLQYRLTDMPVSVAEHERFLHPVNERLVKAFKAVGHKNPQGETKLLLLLIDALWKNEIQHGSDHTQALVQLVKQKYRQQAAQYQFSGLAASFV